MSIFDWREVLNTAVQMLNSEFMAEMLQQREIHGVKATMGPLDSSFLYAITRWRKPKVIIETGGYLGMSSAFILKAIHDEGITDAKLYSVEQNANCAHGILIPENLKRNYILLQGELEGFIKRRELPDKIDMFLHDSSHRYKHMLMEFKYFWKKMSDGDLLASHDVNMAAAFMDFVSKTYKHVDGKNDLTRTSHYEWGRVEKMGFVIKKISTSSKRWGWL